MSSAGLPITNSAAAASPSSSSRPTGWWRTALGYINESTKFIVSALAFATLVTFPNVQTCWCILGSVVNSVNGKILKKMLNHERPEGAVKADPGMPSSHAVSLSFLSAYAAAALILHGGTAGGVIPDWAVLPGAGLLVAAGVFLTWLRVTLGYHTPPQVLVGYAMGAGTAMAWLAAGETVVGPALEANPQLVQGLRVALGVAVGVFALTALRWVEEAKEWVRMKTKKDE